MKTKTQSAQITAPGIEININGIHANISRAYEIAKVGGHSVTLCYYKNKDDKERTVKQDDLMLIDQFYGFYSVANGDLLIEVIRPSFDDIYASTRRRFETIDDVNERIKQAKNNALPTAMHNEACYSLLKTAYERLNFGMDDVMRIFKVSQTIAKMANSPTIRSEHVAEAIQYRALLDDENVKRFILH